MIEAKRFLDKLWTKQWLEANEFSVPKTLALFRLADFGPVMAYTKALANYTKKFVVKPANSRLSRGALIIQKVENDDFEYDDDCYTDDRGIVKMLGSSVKLEEQGFLFMAEEFVSSHQKFKWAQESSWGSVGCRFLVHEGKVVIIAVMCPLKATHGLAGALSRGTVKYGYLSPTGEALTADQVAEAQGDTLNEHSRNIITHKTLNVPAEPFEGVAEVTTQIEERLAPLVTPFVPKKGQDRAKPRPWSVDGVFNTSGRFVVLECNHKPGHRFTRPVQ